MTASFPIVGIGASAGGVEALEAFFRGMPADSGCALIIVTHLSPERRSLLPEIIARYTEMPVQEVANGVAPEPNQVYVLPADAVLGIRGGKLTLRRRGSPRPERKPIDIFLSALAKDVGDYSAGIILSGGDGDGALGIKAIKEAGGLTLAQVGDGDGPRHSDMPQSAIATGLVDFAVPANEMGARLADFARSFDLLDGLGGDRRSGGGGRALQAARQEICTILRNQLGHDFSGYKEKTFLRRVQRRMQVNRLDTLGAYLEQLRRDPKEAVALFRDLLINVTNFFRDAEAFKILEETVVPKVFEGRDANDTVRVWVPGCATGEEVYSIAILLREHLDTLDAAPTVQVFATDIDEPALSVARAGRYPETQLEDIPAERRARFFHLEGGSALVSKEVRELCIFSTHSVIRDPPFTRLDLVSCRNLLIYFGPDAQSHAIPTFHYALRPGGYLFLGMSENVSQFGELFIPLDKKHRVFRRRDEGGAVTRLPLVVNALRPAPYPLQPSGRGGLAGAPLRQSVEAHVLERISPAHVVVNRDGDVVYYSARTGKYLEATPGAPSRQLLTMARKGLRLDLRALLREVIETSRRVVRDSVALDTDDQRVQRVSIAIEPLTEAGPDGLYLVVFSDVGPTVGRDEAAASRAGPDENALQLDRELHETRERLQSLVEEYETALEELKSSNEELVSLNEELQSANEEMEASKEELQSVNEELHTVNGELGAKVEQLDRANDDLTNLFESTRVATVFLDSDLVIRSFTPTASQIFSILPGDRGRSLTDFASRVALPELLADVRSVLTSGVTLERSIAPEPGSAHYLLRIVPYRDRQSRIDGVVLSFVDVTSLTQSEARQRVLVAELNHRVKNMLMVVVGVAEQTFRTSADGRDFKDRLIDRILGMSKSYELLSQENWSDALLADIVRPHLEAFGLERVRLHGTDVRMKPAQALAVGMIVHELATNAGKYGALGSPAGTVVLTWETRPGKSGTELELCWAEHDGPPVAAPKKMGFGLKLVREQAAYSLRGSADVKFEPDGLVVRIVFPLEGWDGE